MQAVFGLVEDDRRGRFEDVGAHFLAAVGRQAVHQERARLGQRHEALVHLVRREHFPPTLRLPPPVPSKSRYRCTRRRRRRPRRPHRRRAAAARRIGRRRGPLHNGVRELVPFRARHVHVHPQHGGRMGQRRRHVVAVADERNRPAPKGAPSLAQRQAVGHRLTRVLLVGQRVDHVQPRGRSGELLEQALREGPDDDGFDPPLEAACDVDHRLARAERDVRLQRQHMAAELAHGDLERGARPERRLLEQHRHMTAGEEIRRRRLTAERPVGFHLRGQLQASFEVSGLEVENREKVFANGAVVISFFLRRGPTPGACAFAASGRSALVRRTVRSVQRRSIALSTFYSRR